MKNNYLKLDTTIFFNRELTEEDHTEFLDSFVDLVESWNAECATFSKLMSDEDFE